MSSKLCMERAMGFEPHSVAGSALKPASRLPLRGSPPSCLPTKGACSLRNPLSWVQINKLASVWSGRWDLNPRQLAWEARTLPLSYARPSRRIGILHHHVSWCNLLGVIPVSATLVKRPSSIVGIETPLIPVILALYQPNHALPILRGQVGQRHRSTGLEEHEGIGVIRQRSSQ